MGMCWPRRQHSEVEIIESMIQYSTFYENLFSHQELKVAKFPDRCFNCTSCKKTFNRDACAAQNIQQNKVNQMNLWTAEDFEQGAKVKSMGGNVPKIFASMLHNYVQFSPFKTLEIHFGLTPASKRHWDWSRRSQRARASHHSSNPAKKPFSTTGSLSNSALSTSSWSAAILTDNKLNHWARP